MEGTIEYIETTIFTKKILEIGTDEELRNLQNELSQTPEKGNIIEGTGGLRKIRIAIKGKGKRGGGRVIYLYLKIKHKIYLCFIYSKNSLENLTSDQKKELRFLVQKIKEENKV